MGSDFGEWREMLERDNTDGTVAHYLSWGQRFEEWLDTDEPGAGELAAFDAFLRDGDALPDGGGDFGPWAGTRPPSEGYAYSTRVLAVSAAKSWADFAYGAEFSGREAHQVQNLVEGDKPAFDPEIATREQVSAVLDETEDCHSPACHAMTITGYDAIMRCVEICEARWDDFNPDTGTLFVRGAKGSQNRHVSLSPATLEALGEYREFARERIGSPEALFHTFHEHWAGNSWHPASWSRHFRERHWPAGFHSFARHTPVTRRLQDGQSLTAVNQRARHNSIEMTQKYNHLADGGGLPELE